jgi:branched-chain amino acid transport system permease protein
MTQFLQATVNGVALAGIYALIALGFVIIYKSMQVLNFAQPALLLLGGYWVLYFATVWGWPFWIAIVAGAVFAAISGIVVQLLALRPMVGKPVFAVAIMTIGLNTILTTIADDLLGLDLRQMGDPWGIESVTFGDLFITHRQIAVLVTVVAVFVALALFFRYSRMGLAMRAAAFDQEVALTQGVSVNSVFALSWAMAAVLAMLGGIFLGTPVGLSTTASFSALKALPVVVVGGLDSVPGAVVGALIIALGETYVGAYQTNIGFLNALGQGFSQVVPYLIMFVVLLVRPYGLFGTKEVERV